MLGRFLTFMALSLIIPHHLHAADGKDFFNFITIERSEGKIGRVTLKKKNQRFTTDELIDGFLRKIKSSQDRIGFLEGSLDVYDWPEEYRKKTEEALELLKQNDLKPILEHPELKKALDVVFQQANSETLSFRVLAVPDDSQYFDNRERILKILRQASDLVRLAFGNSYGAAIALYLVQVSFDMILERRNYFQNYLLFHMEKYGPEKFGISPLEAAKIKSSIFESRIRWWEFWERNESDLNWEGYGHNKHLDDLIAAKKRKRACVNELDEWGGPMGFAFYDGRIGESRRIVNLVTPRHLFSNKLSHTFDFSHPKKVVGLRSLYFLLQLGVRLAPAPAASTIFDFFMDSLYVPHRQVEGVLFGYFRDEGSYGQAKQIAFQSINPFVVAEILSK